jgi:hypothetical protein
VGVRDIGFAGEKGRGQDIEQNRSLHDCNQRGAPTSLTLHDQDCAERSVGLATNCQVYTFPRGNPGEAEPDPKAQPRRLGAPRRGGYGSSFNKSVRSCFCCRA